MALNPGMTGHRHSAETRAKMSAASKGKLKSLEHRAALSAAKLGTTRSVSSIEKQSATCAAKPRRDPRDFSRGTFEQSTLRKHDLSVQDFAALWLKSDGKCENPGCRRTLSLDSRNWALDHDHSCCPSYKHCGNCLRGLLCSQCNAALGMLDDSEERALGLISYLRRSTPKPTPQ